MNVDIDNILEDLKRRFAAPLPEYYKRRIIFWNDEERECEDKLDEIHIDNVKFVVLTDKNTYEVKKLLSNDDTNSNYLVYNPLSFNSPEDDWLIDIKLYSESYCADLISIWMNEMGLADNITMRRLTKYYRKYLNAKEHRNKITVQDRIPANTAQFHLAIMAAICGIKAPHPNIILKTVFSAGLNKDENPIYQDIVKFGAEDAFWKMATQGTGYRHFDEKWKEAANSNTAFNTEDAELNSLFVHILLTASTKTLAVEHFSGLERFISVPHQAFCYDFISGWLLSSDNSRLYEFARYTEEETHIDRRFYKLPPEDIADTECFPCIDEIILTKIMTEISNQIIDSDKIKKITEKRRTFTWYEQFADFYDGLIQAANMQDFFKEHSAGFHEAMPKTIWKKYTEDYYRMDNYYRLFQLSFQKSLQTSNVLLDDLNKQVADIIEHLYSNWFLGNLAINWSNVCAEEFEENGKISGIPQQEDFYENYIENADSRVFVIISDALRYETAVTLAGELRQETQCSVKINNMQSIFPSITKFGMAALLPHDKLTAEIKNENLCVLADGISTSSQSRDKVLKNKNSASTALQYKNIIGLKRADRTALIKGMDVVYIYHDTIDEASHHSDTAVFPACDKAITEIKNLIRIIVNDFSGRNIIITADHGFLYTYSPLNEDSKADKTGFDSMDIEYGRRYAIIKKGAKPEFLMPVKFLDGNSEFEGFTPRENIRIKMNGGGLNFVHGGISLQETVVPVIEYHHLRNDSQEYKLNKHKYDTKPVSVNLISSNRKISNLIFNLNFYQTEPVSANRVAQTYLIYFTDSNGKQISDVQKIIADKTSDDRTQRTYRCTFNLKPLKYRREETYYLVIQDEQGLDLPQREAFEINIAFAVDDFNFFNN